MNIARENRDGQVVVLKVTVDEADYGQAVDKALHAYKRKANIPGFRPGMVPMSIINRLYRKGAVAEEAYRTASKAAFDYLETEHIDFMGDVMPSDEQGDFDFENATSHEFVFELGLAPEVKIDLGGEQLTRYTIEVNAEMREGLRKQFMGRYGRLVDVERVEKDEAITGTLDNGTVRVEDAYIGLVSMEEAERAPYIGVKPGDVLEVNIEELYKTPSQRATMMRMKEEELAGIDPHFKFTVEKVRRFAEPELDEEFFKTAFPDGSVTDAAGLEKFFEQRIASDLARESEYLFAAQLRKLLLRKAGLQLPEDFLRRWLFKINEGKFTMEEIDKDFAGFLEMMRWNLIQKHYVKEFDIKVSDEEVNAEARALAAAQFAAYGMGNVGDELLDRYAAQLLQNKQEAEKVVEKLYERKVLDSVAAGIKTDARTVSADEFGQIARSLE